jgi:hypothetical protein
MSKNGTTWRLYLRCFTYLKFEIRKDKIGADYWHPGWELSPIIRTKFYCRIKDDMKINAIAKWRHTNLDSIGKRTHKQCAPTPFQNKFLTTDENEEETSPCKNVQFIKTVFSQDVNDIQSLEMFRWWWEGKSSHACTVDLCHPRNQIWLKRYIEFNECHNN